MSDVRGRPKPQNKAFAGPTVASNGTLTIVGGALPLPVRGAVADGPL